MPNCNPSRILVIGSGFIASEAYKEFRSQGWNVYVYYSKYKNPRIDDCSLVKLELNVNDLSESIKSLDPQYILIATGTSFIPSVNKNIPASIDAHLNFALHIYNAVVKSKCSRLEKILTIGSASEYGVFSNAPKKESDITSPLDAYGIIKLSQYLQGHYYYEKYGLPVVHARQFNTTGNMQSDKFVIPSICKQVVNNAIDDKTYIEVGDIDVYRDFLDIRDTIKAYKILLQKGTPGDVYNVCSGEEHQIKHIIDEISLKTGLTIDVKISENLKRKSYMKNNHIFGDPSKLSDLGWCRDYTLSQTLHDLVEYYQQIK